MAKGEANVWAALGRKPTSYDHPQAAREKRDKRWDKEQNRYNPFDEMRADELKLRDEVGADYKRRKDRHNRQNDPKSPFRTIVF